MSSVKSGFNIKRIMDTSGILLVNLAKGHLAGNADQFGALLMADIEMSFLSRKSNERTPFALYVDEFQNIATDSFGTVLTEERKFGLWWHERPARDIRSREASDTFSDNGSSVFEATG